MSERKKIEDRIRKKEQEIQELDIKMREARVYIQAMQDVLKILPREQKQAESSADGPVSLREGSLASMARDAILKRGSPAHVSDLLTDMGKEDNRENRTSLSGALAAYVRKGEVFTRPAPNRFGLIELGHAAMQHEPSDPPDDFGQTDST